MKQEHGQDAARLGWPPLIVKMIANADLGTA
jgi:hypothetical protein